MTTIWTPPSAGVQWYNASNVPHPQQEFSDTMPQMCPTLSRSSVIQCLKCDDVLKVFMWQNVWRCPWLPCVYVLCTGILVAEVKSVSIPTERSPVPVLQNPRGPIPDLQYQWGPILQGLRGLILGLQFPEADLRALLHTIRRQNQVLPNRRWSMGNYCVILHHVRANGR